jgi:hypothetical protein
VPPTTNERKRGLGNSEIEGSHSDTYLLRINRLSMYPDPRKAWRGDLAGPPAAESGKGFIYNPI